MRKCIIILIGLLSVFKGVIVVGHPPPWANIAFSGPSNVTAYYGEPVVLRANIEMRNVRIAEFTAIPRVTIQPVASSPWILCPPFHASSYMGGACDVKLIVDTYGPSLGGSLLLRLGGPQTIQSPYFVVTIIPHPLSVTAIPPKMAVAHQPFVYDLKPYIAYYAENVRMGRSVIGIVTPAEQNGVRFDQASFSLVGTPTQAGIYRFYIGATSPGGSSTAVREMILDVASDTVDKPVFKYHSAFAYVVAGIPYAFNITDLLKVEGEEPGVSDEISFRFEDASQQLRWLGIQKEENGYYIKGTPLANGAGTVGRVHIIAHSESGGDSLPLVFTVSSAPDSGRRAVISQSAFDIVAGEVVSIDLMTRIFDPSGDPNLRIVVDAIEPEAPWLSISTTKRITGLVPWEVVGQAYYLTLHANTVTGGNSDAVTIRLQVACDPKKTPRFGLIHPVIPAMYRGMPYHHSFVVDEAITPLFREIPYQTYFAKGYPHPAWLRLHHNTLMADRVPDDARAPSSIWVVVHNRPGGDSDPTEIQLPIVS